MNTDPVIGVIGGTGPYAGLDLTRKVLGNTRACTDVDHLPIVMVSRPAEIPKRNAFLLGETDVNPGPAIARVAMTLERADASVVGMSSNTAHAASIFDLIRNRLRDAGCGIRLLNMVDETIRFLREYHADCARIGVLSSLGSYRLRIHQDALETAGFETILPDENVRENIVHRTIFDPSYGIKAHADPISKIARQSLLSAIDHLRDKGAEAILLGCADLSLAIPETEIDAVMMIDPTWILARALIRETYPDRLKPM